MALDSVEGFFGIELSKKCKTAEWKGPEEVEDNTEVKLQLSHACLGADAKEGERNVVDVTTADIYGKEVTHTIVSLQIGHTEMVALNLGFLEKSTFKLVKGNGPVHLSGAYLHALGDMSDDESDSDEESEEEDVPDLVKAAEKKETVSDEKPEKKDKAPEAKKDTTKAKVLTNGHKDDKQKTPVKKQEQKAKQQEEQKTPNNPKTPDVTDKKGKTPKSDKKKEKDAKTPVAAPASIEDVKKKLLKSPNLPKTVEKFKNFMKSAHKVTDDGDVTGLWDWLQKNKK
eukprot:gene15338-6559_t